MYLRHTWTVSCQNWPASVHYYKTICCASVHSEATSNTLKISHCLLLAHMSLSFCSTLVSFHMKLLDRQPDGRARSVSFSHTHTHTHTHTPGIPNGGKVCLVHRHTLCRVLQIGFPFSMYLSSIDCSFRRYASSYDSAVYIYTWTYNSPTLLVNAEHCGGELCTCTCTAWAWLHRTHDSSYDSHMHSLEDMTDVYMYISCITHCTYLGSVPNLPFPGWYRAAQCSRTAGPSVGTDWLHQECQGSRQDCQVMHLVCVHKDMYLCALTNADMSTCICRSKFLGNARISQELPSASVFGRHRTLRQPNTG